MLIFHKKLEVLFKIIYLVNISLISPFRNWAEKPPRGCSGVNKTIPDGHIYVKGELKNKFLVGADQLRNKILGSKEESEVAFSSNFHSSFCPTSSPCGALINPYLT